MVGGFHHRPVGHPAFPFAPSHRCHQDHPFVQGWFLNQGPLSPTDSSQPSFSPGPSVNGALPDPGRPVAGARRGPPVPRKERRRTESINSAFSELRECIPNVPADTKLSKIKTLRLATSYIAYLMETLAKDSQGGETEAFRADLKKMESREGKRKRETVRTGHAANRHTHTHTVGMVLLNHVNVSNSLAPGTGSIDVLR